MLVQVYGRPMCDACEALTNYLDFKGVFYVYNNVEYMDIGDVTHVIMNRRDPNNRKLPILFVDGRELEGNDEITKFFERVSTATTGRLGSSNIPKEGRDLSSVNSNNEHELDSREGSSEDQGGTLGSKAS